MTKDDWARVVGIVFARWPNTDWPKATVAAYYEDMQPYDVEDAIEAVKRLSRTDEYAPKLVQLMLALLEVRVEKRKEREKNVLSIHDRPWSAVVDPEILKQCRDVFEKVKTSLPYVPPNEPVTDDTDLALFTRVLQGSTLGEPSEAVKERARYLSYLARQAEENNAELQPDHVRSRRRGRRSPHGTKA